MIPWQPGAPVVDAGEVGQWFGACQRDLAARLRWTVTSNPADANHAPRVIVAQNDHTVSPGYHCRSSILMATGWH